MAVPEGKVDDILAGKKGADGKPLEEDKVEQQEVSPKAESRDKRCGCSAREYPAAWARGDVAPDVPCRPHRPGERPRKPRGAGGTGGMPERTLEAALSPPFPRSRAGGP
ncbi:hypothetical protein VTN02DRAFT_5265 [Thermoascus thermophilus]